MYKKNYALVFVRRQINRNPAQIDKITIKEVWLIARYEISLHTGVF